MNDHALHNLPVADDVPIPVIAEALFGGIHDQSKSAPEPEPVYRPHVVHQQVSVRPPLPVYLATSVVVFFCFLSAMDSVGFVPYYIDGTSPTTSLATSTINSDETLALSSLPQLGENQTPTAGVTFTTGTGQITIPSTATGAQSANHSSAQIANHVATPVRLIINSQSIDLPVQNPSTRDVDALDALLVNGPARYSASAKLGEKGNVVIFAHSSHLPIVHNQMFRAFNKIPDMATGDMITLVGSDGKRYDYAVDSVKKATTDDGTTIDLGGSAQTLTLVTCDTLTGKSARFILTARFVGVE